MKKPILATFGVAGACAACCAIPIAIPLLSGLSVASLLSFEWAQTTLTSGTLAVAAGIATAIAAGVGLWVARRRQPALACSVPVDVKATSCGCTS
ncbi:MAG: hypothetical protein Q8K31_04140 [Burkholderiaceae bacterium]|nr:hypothetical protein [Pseudomonadota bacterium]MDO8277911.1 hypothetical protein [Burkholderiaceae bacterium]MDP1968361.1 hypothetical protein [Burkholderiaceae bacterium]MDP3138053.1 hypothetical protein [Burkholderiaceae bacterium]